MIYSDVTDVLLFFKNNSTVSGIQRVVSLMILETADPSHPFHHEVAWVGINAETGGMRIIPAEGLRDLVRMVAESRVDRASLDLQLEALAAQSHPVDLTPDDTYIVVGAFWADPRIVTEMRRMASSGAKIGMLIYDLIPVLHPEYCDAGLSREFRRTLDVALPLCDFVLTISEFVADELRAYIGDGSFPAISVKAIPLATELTQTAREVVSEPSASAQAATAEPFVLAVGSLEIRKNYGYLFAIWREACRLDAHFPRLVLVGRKGWLIEDLWQQLKATNFLDGRIVVLTHASDADLSYLYRKCLFTAFVSYVEGWGLPVGESLSYGKICLASGTSSIPEVGGPLCVYVDPLNIRDGLEKVTRLVASPAHLQSLEDRIRREFSARTWREVSVNLFESTARADALSEKPIILARPQTRGWLDFGANVGLNLAGASTLRAADILWSGWFPPESWGSWAQASPARVRFSVPQAATCVIIFRVALPHWRTIGDLRISRRGSVYFRGLVAQDQCVTIELGSENGEFDLILECDTMTSPMSDDTREIGVGLKGLFIYSTNNLEERVMGMQDLVLQGLNLSSQS